MPGPELMNVDLRSIARQMTRSAGMIQNTRFEMVTGVMRTNSGVGMTAVTMPTPSR